MLKLFRIMKTFDVFDTAIPFDGILDAYEKNQLLYAFGFFILLGSTTLGGISIYMAEHQLNEGITTLTDGLWWAMVTLTTVGYGDILTGDRNRTRCGWFVDGRGHVYSSHCLLGLSVKPYCHRFWQLERGTISYEQHHETPCHLWILYRSTISLTTLEEEFDFNSIKPIILAPFKRL